MAGFFDSAVQEDSAQIAESPAPRAEAAIESAETASVSAFFAMPAAEEAPSDIVIEDSPVEEAPVFVAAAEETVSPMFAAAPVEAVAVAAPVVSAISSDEDMDASSIILEAIAKMSALRDRSATKRDAIMDEVESINAQIAELKERAKERTNRARDIAAEMKKVEESIAVLQAQKA